MEYILVKVRADKRQQRHNHQMHRRILHQRPHVHRSRGAHLQGDLTALTGYFEISAVSKKKYVDVFFDNQGGEDCRSYECRTNFITANEKTGAEKRTPANYLVCAPDLHMALSRFDGYMRGTLADFELTAVIETPILDVFTDNANAVQQ